MTTEKIDVSPPVKRVLEHIKDVEGHLTIDSAVRSRLKSNDWNFEERRE
jgi:hypothetical protein